MFQLNIIGFTLDLIGKVLIAYTALRVHHRFWQEHKIDQAVFSTMRTEQYLGILGISLLIIGYVLQLSEKLS